MRTYHQPVLADDVVSFLAPTPPGTWVDGTLGGGGHTAALLAQAGQDRRVVGVDLDPEALAAARARLDDDRLTVLLGSFAELRRLLEAAGIACDRALSGILLDLGVSSHQLDSPERGFGLKHAGAPLDMRMNPASDALTALELLESLSEAELGRLLEAYGEVPQARRVARAILAAVALGRVRTTGDLARLVESVQENPRPTRIHPATTVFQALRIAVNGELEALDRVLVEAPGLLAPGGRMAVIAYHSLEDRRVKQAFHLGAEGPPRPRRLPPPSAWRPCWRLVTRRAVVASDAEVAQNPRARSARLRVAECVAGGAP